MRCLRCQGAMMGERVYTRSGEIHMSRCPYCGDMVDSIVLLNRNRSNPFVKRPQIHKHRHKASLF